MEPDTELVDKLLSKHHDIQPAGVNRQNLYNRTRIVHENAVGRQQYVIEIVFELNQSARTNHKDIGIQPDRVFENILAGIGVNLLKVTIFSVPGAAAEHAAHGQQLVE